MDVRLDVAQIDKNALSPRPASLYAADSMPVPWITVDSARLWALSNFTFLTVVHLNPYQRCLIPAYPPPKKRLIQPGRPPNPASVARL